MDILGTEHVSTNSKPKIVRQQKQLMLIQLTGSKPNQLRHPYKYIQEKTKVLDTISLEHDINIDFEENSLHQEGVISEICQR